MPRKHKGYKPIQLRLTAMMDVIFQLIVFFLLIMNFSAAELPEIDVPRITEPALHELHDRDRVIVNVQTERKVGAPRKPTAVTKWIIAEGKRFEPNQMGDLSSLLDKRREEIGEDEKGKPKIQVDLRSDSTAEYGDVQKVMQAITEAKIGRFNMIALQEGEK